MEANDTFQLNDVNEVTDSDEEELESVSLHQDTDSDDLPPSLLRYFETSRSRAAAYERIITEELEDFPASHHTEHMVDFPFGLHEDLLNPSEQVIGDSEHKESNASSADTETEELCYNNEDESVESELVLEFKAERQRRLCEEMKREEQMRRREEDFQKELRRIMEEEKLQQEELELKVKSTQEKLQQEMMLQQELLSNLHRQVKEERRRTEEELQRMKEEEDKRRREEEQKRMMDEEDKMRREEEQKRRKDEEDKRKEEEQKRMKKEEDKRRREEEQKKIKDEEDKRREEEQKRRKDEADKRREEEQKKLKEEEDKRRREEEQKRRKDEEDKRRKEEEQKRRKDEADKRREEEQKKMKDEEDKRRREEEQKRRKDEEDKRKREEEQKRMEEEEQKRKKDEEDKRKDEEDKRRREEEQKRMMDEEDKMRREEEQKRRKDEEDKRKEEEQKRMKKEEDKRGREEEQKKMKDEEDKRREEEQKRRKDEADKRREEEQKKLKEEEDKRRREEEQKRRKDEEDKRRKEEEQKRRKDEADKRREEEQKKMKDEEDKRRREEEQKKMKDEEDKRRREEEQKRMEEEEQKRKKDEEDKRKDEEDKRRREEEQKRRKDEEDKRKEEEQKKRDAEEMKLKCEDERRRREEERCEIDLEKKKFEDEERMMKEEEEAARKKMENEKRKMEDAGSDVYHLGLSELTERKRRVWMKDCTSWSTLRLQHSRRKQRGSTRRRGAGGATGDGSLTPLCPDALLQATGCKTLQEVTTVTLENLPGCSLSTLTQCSLLQSLTLRRCGLRALEGVSQLALLCYLDLQENHISFLDCENMMNLRVLLLGHNQLTSIHGLAGAQNLNILDLSHNSITRIAGLESVRNLQTLSLDHNQLISTKGLRDVITLLHLSCSHNHLVRVEGLENNVLLSTLDLRANSLSQPPSLNNHVLLRALLLDDNSISSLQSLTSCWLPLLQQLSVPHNRLTELPPMWDCVSLTGLDVGFNLLSEVNNVCDALVGCEFLRDLHLTGNPLQQEKDWRSTLQRAVPTLRTVDHQEVFICPAVQQLSSASGHFLSLCRAQLQQTQHIQQQLSTELSEASCSLDAVKASCRLLTRTLQLARDHRRAHERGDNAVASPQETLTTAEEETEEPGPETGSDRVQSNRPGLDLQNTAAVVIQQLWRRSRRRCGNIVSSSEEEGGRGGDVDGGRGGDGGRPESGPSCVAGRRVAAATVLQASWRGFALRRKLTSALAAVTRSHVGEEEDDALEELDVDEFVFDEASLEETWTLSEDSPQQPHGYQSIPPPPPPPPSSSPPPPPAPPPAPPPPPLRQAWVPGDHEDSAGLRLSPDSCSRSSSSMSVASGRSETSEKIMEEWGFTNSHTAFQMLKRAQKMKSQRKRDDPSIRLALFRKCSPGHVGARNKAAQHTWTDMKVAGVGRQQEVKVGGQRWIHQDSESERFLPEISSDILNGGRVQLVADPGYTSRLHHASPAAPPSELSLRNSVGHTRNRVPCPQPCVVSSPSRKERISLRDPVLLSSGWGGGKKRNRVHK